MSISPPMQIALALAESAAACSEVPVGAVVVDAQGNVIGRGFNQPIGARDPTAHAEVVALREAALAVGNYRLPGCSLYVTVEPCTMCAGALVHARIDTLVFGTREPKAGAIVSRSRVLEGDGLNHRVNWQEGDGAEEAARLMKQFFTSRRDGELRT